MLASLLKAYPGSEFVVQYRKDEHKDVLLQFSSHIRPLKGELAELSSVTTHPFDCRADVYRLLDLLQLPFKTRLSSPKRLLELTSSSMPQSEQLFVL